MQSTYDFWGYVVKDAFKESIQGFLQLFDVLSKYHLEGLGDKDDLQSFRNTIETLVLKDIIEEIDKDAEIWKMIEARVG